MRFSRLVIGTLVIFLAVWVIVQEQLAGASANAVLNAQVLTVTTPIAGRVTDLDRSLGSAVSRGDPLGAVIDDRVDAVRLEDLILQRDQIRRTLEPLALRRTELQSQITELTARTQTFTKTTLDGLRVALAEAEERLRLLSRPEGGGDLIAISRAREDVGRAMAILESAESGVFIAGGYNDAPFSEQAAFDLTAQTAALDHEITMAEAGIEALGQRIALEQARVGRATTTSITAPVSGVIWERFVASGVYVQRGDPILRIVNCEDAFVTLSVTQSVFNRLEPGATATFRFDGSGEVLSGIVARLAGTSAASFYGSLAVAPSQQHLERADVLLQLPNLSDHPDLRCAIGRTGRAFFEVRPLDWLRAYFR